MISLNKMIQPNNAYPAPLQFHAIVQEFGIMVHKVYVRDALILMIFMILQLKTALLAILNTALNAIKLILHNVQCANQIMFYIMAHVVNFQIIVIRESCGLIIRLQFVTLIHVTTDIIMMMVPLDNLLHLALCVISMSQDATVLKEVFIHNVVQEDLIK